MKNESAPTTRGRSRLAAVFVFALGVAVLVASRPLRVGEAKLEAFLLPLFGVPARQIENVVQAQVDDRWVGLAITLGCSVGPLFAVFMLGAAPFLWFRRFPFSRVLLGVAVLAVVLNIANQIRIAVIVASMGQWGIERGYEISHVFLGSAITTVGFVLGLVVFVKALIGSQARRAVGGHA